MKGFLLGLGILGVIVLLFVSSAIGTYNSLVTKHTEVEIQRAQTETQLQRRFDLVPSLVSSVKGAMHQEQAVFGAIAEARTKYAGTQPNTPERLDAAQGYESALARLLVIMENYPQLKSIDTVQNLMTQLEGTENRISVARQRYNESVQEYNVTLRSFPTNLIGGILGFVAEKPFAAVEDANKAVPIDLTN